MPAPETAIYDHALRRDTPLARKLKAQVGAEGPLTVRAYMDACLNDPEHGYYRTRTAIGRTGDFTTAPEISQVFGELIGLWCAVVWQQMGSPVRFHLIELGAGRGTLLADALRAVRLVPGFTAALSLHIVDHNPILIEMQRTALASCQVPITWHTRLEAVPQGQPSIWIANEFLDTVPLEQFNRIDGRWATRAIGLDAAGALAFVPTPSHWHVLPTPKFPATRRGARHTTATSTKAKAGSMHSSNRCRRARRPRRSLHCSSITVTSAGRTSIRCRPCAVTCRNTF